MSSILSQIVPGLSGTAEYVLIFALCAAGSAFLVGFLFKQIRRYGAYAYANARVNAMKGALLTNGELEPLVQGQDLQNFISLLKDSAYSPYLENIEEFTTNNIESSLQNHLIDSHGKISRIAPEDIRIIFREMEKIHEIENLKKILVDKSIEKSPEKIEEELPPKKFLPGEIYEKLIEAEDINNAILTFEETEYWEPLEEASTEFEEVGNLLPLLFALEKKYWTGVWKTAKESDAKYSETILEALGKKIDIQNIQTVLRCKSQEVYSEEIEKFIIPIYSEIKPKILERAIESKNLEEAFTVLEDSPYGEPISKTRLEYEETGSIFSAEKILSEFLLRKLRTLSIQHYTEAGPLVAFFYEKNTEVKNLITIANGKAENMKPEEIKEKLVTPEVER